MKNPLILTISLVLAALLGGYAAAVADPALQECKAPFKPAVEISGETATNDELQAIYDSVKRFQAQLEKYRACLDEKMTAAREAEDTEALAELTTEYNASVDAEESVVADFNEALQACRAANTCPKDG